jgi:tRNA(Ser,Leu) C12 N-acetylase TAN1
MHEMILCKLGEVVLKGLNRRSFEMKLMGNIRRRTGRFGRFRVYSKQSTIYVEPAEETCDLAGAYAACKQVFGIIAVARALPCAKEKEAILETAKAYLGDALTAARSFKVESKRADKSFPMSSIQLSQWVGGHLHEAFPHLAVDVHHPELTVDIQMGSVEEVYRWVREDKADMGFASLQDGMTMDWLPLAEDPLLAILPPEYDLGGRERFDVRDFSSHEFLMPSMGFHLDILRALNAPASRR